MIKLTFLQRLAIQLLKLGPTPNHISIIMDGNRRYARQSNLSLQEGHQRGFDALMRTLQYGKEIGIKELTVFAFSIENYNRPKDEVEYLMNMAKQKLGESQDFFQKNQIQVKLCGDMQYVEEELRQKLNEVEEKTKKYTQYKLNFCFSYNFTNEWERALRQLPSGLTKQQFFQQVQEHLISRPDILMRTSGEQRFSNYMLHQIRSDTLIYFTRRKWPELNFWDFFKMIMFFYYYRKVDVAELVQGVGLRLQSERARVRISPSTIFFFLIN
ncbi:hypothetical protein pb186bvf_005794 [Paramecium bursaria]